MLERVCRCGFSGAIAGPIVEFDVSTFCLKGLTFTGSAVIDLDVFPELVDYLEAGPIKPVLVITYALGQLVEAKRVVVEKRRAKLLSYRRR